MEHFILLSWYTDGSGEPHITPYYIDRERDEPKDIVKNFIEAWQVARQYGDLIEIFTADAEKLGEINS